MVMEHRASRDKRRKMGMEVREGGATQRGKRGMQPQRVRDMTSLMFHLQVIRHIYYLYLCVVHPRPHIRLYVSGLVPVIFATYLVAIICPAMRHVHICGGGLAHRAHRLRHRASHRGELLGWYQEFATLTSYTVDNHHHIDPHGPSSLAECKSDQTRYQ